VKKYADLRAQAIKAVKEYKQEVEGGKFPSEEHSFK
jgi:ketopantoate hydroxymethyltransferase